MQNFFLVHVDQTTLDSNKPYSLSFSHQLLRLRPKRNSLKVTNNYLHTLDLQFLAQSSLEKRNQKPVQESPKWQDDDDIACIMWPWMLCCPCKIVHISANRIITMYECKWKPTKFLSAHHHFQHEKPGKRHDCKLQWLGLSRTAHLPMPVNQCLVPIILLMGVLPS